MTATEVIEADLTWTGDAFVSGVQVETDGAGVITRVGDLAATPTRRLRGRALLPGFVNAHSHAFQRGLRGHGEIFPAGAGSFWTWREAMYRLVGAMDASRLAALARSAFAEMRASGITTVGEFHYLHHDASERGFAFDEIVLEAAAAVGVRMALLQTCYRTGDIDAPLSGPQRRFGVDDLDAYWDQVDHLATRIDPARQSLGVVAHSIRALGLEDIVALHEEATRRGMIFHMHVEEQPREIEACVRRYHQPPMALLNEHLTISPFFTAVHCTHTAADDMERFLAAGGNVCLCPLTEANLGDGVAAVGAILRQGGCICVGSDSNLRIGPLEELRWLEYGQRLRGQERGVVRDERGRVTPHLLNMATRHGARALGVRAGVIAPEKHADFCVVDLEHPTLVGATPETLLDTLIFGADNEVIAATCVAGQWKEHR